MFKTQNKLAEAEKTYKQLLALKRASEGEQHSSTLTTLYNLGRIFESQGKTTQATATCELALEGRRSALGAEYASSSQYICHSSSHRLSLLFTMGLSSL